MYRRCPQKQRPAVRRPARPSAHSGMNLPQFIFWWINLWMFLYTQEVEELRCHTLMGIHGLAYLPGTPLVLGVARGLLLRHKLRRSSAATYTLAPTLAPCGFLGTPFMARRTLPIELAALKRGVRSIDCKAWELAPELAPRLRLPPATALFIHCGCLLLRGTNRLHRGSTPGDLTLCFSPAFTRRTSHAHNNVFYR